MHRLALAGALVLALMAGCAFLVEPLDTGSHQWWDTVRSR